MCLYVSIIQLIWLVVNLVVDSWERTKGTRVHLSLPTQTSHVGLHGHYFLDHPPQVRDRSLLHAPGLDQHPSTLSSSQSPSGLGNLELFPNCLCYRLGRVYKLASCPLVPTLSASLRGFLHSRTALLFLSSCVYYSAVLPNCQPIYAISAVFG